MVAGPAVVAQPVIRASDNVDAAQSSKRRVVFIVGLLRKSVTRSSVVNGKTH
jgi:hypothetical protein